MCCTSVPLVFVAFCQLFVITFHGVFLVSQATGGTIHRIMACESDFSRSQGFNIGVGFSLSNASGFRVNSDLLKLDGSCRRGSWDGVAEAR